jgi:hypothetical protein
MRGGGGHLGKGGGSFTPNGDQSQSSKHDIVRQVSLCDHFPGGSLAQAATRSALGCFRHLYRKEFATATPWIHSRSVQRRPDEIWLGGVRGQPHPLVQVQPVGKMCLLDFLYKLFHYLLTSGSFGDSMSVPLDPSAGVCLVKRKVKGSIPPSSTLLT